MLGNDRKAVEASLLFKNFTVTGLCENYENNASSTIFRQCCEILHSFVMLINKRTLPACVILPIHCLPRQNVRHNRHKCADKRKKSTVNTPSWTRNSTHDNKTRTRMYTSCTRMYTHVNVCR